MPIRNNYWENRVSSLDIYKEKKRRKISRAENIAWTIGGVISGFLIIVIIILAISLANSQSIAGGGELPFRSETKIDLNRSQIIWNLRGPKIITRELKALPRLF